MSDPSQQAWWRMLGWGLLASLLLHWIAFDLMRAAAWLPGVPASASLQVSLRAPEADARREVSQGVPKDAPHDAPRPELKSVLLKPDSVPAGRSTAERTPDPGNGVAAKQLTKQLSEAQAVLEMSVVGLRSGLPAEAMTGLRLALVQLLGGAPAPLLAQGTGPERVMLWCDFDAAGHLLDVRSASGSIDAALLASLRRALGQLVLPATLVGNAFSLDVLLESGE